MNKTTLSILTLTTVLAIPASVLAETTLYGKAHLSVDSIDNGEERRTLVSSNSSRVGIKSSAPLSDTLTVLLQLEGGIEWGTNKDASFSGSRDSFLGLEGKAGTLMVGRLPYHNQWAGKANLFSDQIGDSKNIMNDAGDVAGASVPGSRNDNTLQYTSPELAGFDLTLSLVPNQDFDDDSGEIWGLRGQYTRGPIYLNLSHFNADQGTAEDPTHTAFVVNYELGQWALVAALAADNKHAAGDREAWTLGAALAVAQGHAKLQYSHADDWSEVADSSANMVAVGYDHPLDEKTLLWVAYAHTDNSSQSAYGMSGGGHGSKDIGLVAGNKPSGVGIGIVRSF